MIMKISLNLVNDSLGYLNHLLSESREAREATLEENIPKNLHVPQ